MLNHPGIRHKRITIMATIARKGMKVLERCDYAAQPLRSLYIGKNVGFDPKKELKVEVRTIRMDYPFNVNGYNEYIIRNSKTWGALVRQIVRTFQREYNNGNNGNNITFHGLDDFIIEPVEIHENGMATVRIGS